MSAKHGFLTQYDMWLLEGVGQGIAVLIENPNAIKGS